MQQEDVDDVVPEVLAFRDRASWRMWCQYCLGDHLHKSLGGPQPARCVGRTPFTAHGYILIDGGPYKPAMRTKYLDRRI